ncbi:MAG: hypothetical protein ACOY4R_27725 [Pseudomonadota bacterium]
MIPTEIVLAILAQVRTEAIEIAESPGDDRKTAFDFGMVNGLLRAAKRAEELLKAELDAQAASER